ncbi:uncharacterized protein LOC131801201 [Musca domestica]|uniref:Uncharacterized protein LOC131801201 n=1 Tax=Musca domestica TaxID=7370 RepID=A0ABM3UPG2_MUSDO|nr:uncharacterized protein LOC131801201 [Musca domestica]
MLCKYLTTIFFGICLLMSAANATNPIPDKVSPILASCGSPTQQMVRCINQWACQQAIRLDLRCLLNLNGIPLLGGLLGGEGGLLSGLTGGSGGGGGGAGNIVSGLLGR